MSEEDLDQRRKRLTVAFGWIAGGSIGLLLSYAGYVMSGDGYPTIPVTFGLFVVGAFGGMAVADRVGARGFRALGIVAGVLLSAVVALYLSIAAAHG